MPLINEQNSLRIREETAQFLRAGGVIQKIPHGVSGLDFLSEGRRVHIVVAQQLAMKNCTNCQMPYRPTSGKQKRCESCRAKAEVAKARAKLLREAQ